jgi:membrane-associated PAP2 superfamily phosphatase
LPFPDQPRFETASFFASSPGVSGPFTRFIDRVVTPLKALTAVHCPWSLSEFGGTEQFSSLLEKRAPTEKPGRCWPGGHASAGFSLLALFFFCVIAILALPASRSQ